MAFTWRSGCATTPERAWRVLAYLLVAVLLTPAHRVEAQALAPDYIDEFEGKPRLFVFTDIGNEPDDQMSLVRLLVYSNEFDLEGLIATTSTWQKEKVQPEIIHQVIAAYAKVRPNLEKHAAGWPDAAKLDAMVSAGQPAYGMAATGPVKMSPGARALITAVDRQDARPLWVGVWGGANTFAQALMHVRATRDAAGQQVFLSKVRVYSISDQDDAGPWIRREFPALHYIVKPSPPNSNEYGSATWTGISGDEFYRNCEGADRATVTNDWLDKHIRAKSALGQAYPRFEFIMEGDTPSFLGLIGNGLDSFMNPSWGGWGGRYAYLQPYGETREIWSQGGDVFPRVNSRDAVMGADGKLHVSDQATVWRWRNAFQNDFAARMDWTAKPFEAANHNPRLTVNGNAGTGPVFIDAAVGKTLALDASGSADPDRNQLSYRWFHYPEAGFTPGANMADVEVTRGETAQAMVKIKGTCRPDWLHTNKNCNKGIAHIILAVTDDGAPALTSYRRVVVRVRPDLLP
jgi:hypothetical protein